MSRQETICPIWGTKAWTVKAGDYGRKIIFDSPRAAGHYAITSTAQIMVERLSQQQKLILTTWIVDQVRSGTEVPEIDSYVLKHLPRMRPLRAALKRDRLLLYLERKVPRLGVGLKIDARDTEERQRSIGELLAWTESLEEKELWNLISFCEEEGLLKSRAGQELMLTPKGFEFLDEMDRSQSAASQAFVAMWFDESLGPAYEDGFARAIADAGYRPMRIDRKEHINKIDDEIIAEIRRSRFVVADFTCEPEKPRGGVYFEAGFAHGLRIPVIWTCYKDCLDHVHFDTRQFNHIVWESPQDLYTQLKNRIEAVIGEGPLKRVI